MTESQELGFIGTGVMGEPMCRNLAAKGGRRVTAWDPNGAPLERLRAQGVQRAASAIELGRETGVRLRGAALLAELLEEARAAGFGAAYWPAIAKVVDRS